MLVDGVGQRNRRDACLQENAIVIVRECGKKKKKMPAAQDGRMSVLVGLSDEMKSGGSQMKREQAGRL